MLNAGAVIFNQRYEYIRVIIRMSDVTVKINPGKQHLLTRKDIAKAIGLTDIMDMRTGLIFGLRAIVHAEWVEDMRHDREVRFEIHPEHRWRLFGIATAARLKRIHRDGIVTAINYRLKRNFREMDYDQLVLFLLDKGADAVAGTVRRYKPADAGDPMNELDFVMIRKDIDSVWNIFVLIGEIKVRVFHSKTPWGRRNSDNANRSFLKCKVKYSAMSEIVQRKVAERLKKFMI